MTVEEAYDAAKAELRRAEHLIYVSLKYTRTVDVIKSIVERLINSVDQAAICLLKYKDIRDISRIPKIRIEQVKKEFEKDSKLTNYFDLYFLFRQIDRATFDRTLEYRRHVTMTAFLDDKEIEITIDIIEDYYSKTKEFLAYVENLIGPNE